MSRSNVEVEDCPLVLVNVSSTTAASFVRVSQFRRVCVCVAKKADFFEERVNKKNPVEKPSGLGRATKEQNASFDQRRSDAAPLLLPHAATPKGKKEPQKNHQVRQIPFQPTVKPLQPTATHSKQRITHHSLQEPIVTHYNLV